MTEIEINLIIDDSGDIVLINSTESKRFRISYSSKTLSASEIYDVISYKMTNQYRLKPEIQTEDPRKIEYFDEVRGILNEIIESINTINNAK